MYQDSGISVFTIHHILVNICNGMFTLHCISLYINVIIHIYTNA